MILGGVSAGARNQRCLYIFFFVFTVCSTYMVCIGIMLLSLFRLSRPFPQSHLGVGSLFPVKIERKAHAEERRAAAELEGPKARQLSKKELEEAKKDKQVGHCIVRACTRAVLGQSWGVFLFIEEREENICGAVSFVVLFHEARTQKSARVC